MMLRSLLVLVWPRSPDKSTEFENPLEFDVLGGCHKDEQLVVMAWFVLCASVCGGKCDGVMSGGV